MSDIVPNLRLEMRLRNNALYRAIFSRWASVAEFARETGLSEGCIGAYLNLKKSPWSTLRVGEFKKTASAIADALRLPPDMLFDPEIYGIERTSVSVEIDTRSSLTHDEMLLLIDHTPEPHELAESDAMRDHVRGAVSTLPLRLQRVISMRFGIKSDDNQHGREMTLEEIGDALGVSRTRADQMIKKAVRLLQHPCRSRALEVFVQ